MCDGSLTPRLHLFPSAEITEPCRDMSLSVVVKYSLRVGTTKVLVMPWLGWGDSFGTEGSSCELKVTFVLFHIPN